MDHALARPSHVAAAIAVAWLATFPLAATTASAGSADKSAASTARQATKTRAASAYLADGRLEPGDAVLGIVVGDEPRAYALADLEAAGAAVHDLAGGSRLDVIFDAAEPRVLAVASPVRESLTTNWGTWARMHPDTSLWRPSAIAEPEAIRSADEILVRESRDYRTAFGCAMVQSRMTSPDMEPTGLFVISGTIENVTASSVHHVVLRYELVGDDGKVVYRDEGFNRSAEALAAPKAVDAGEVVPIASGATDTFRMIFLSDELPAFARTRVTIARVY